MTDYEPGSYHLQMNPGLANREGGRLSADVAAADSALDREARDTHTVTVTATDPSDLFDEITVTITGPTGGSDWLILTSKFDTWTEPNASVTNGDPRADAVVESSFCAIETIGVRTIGTRTLYGRC